MILPTGERLSIWVKREKSPLGIQQAQLFISSNGVPVPHSAGDPSQKYRSAYMLVYFLGGFNVIIGLVGVIAEGFLAELGVGIFSVIFGMVYIGLGFAAQLGIRPAIWIAMGLLALDAILILAFSGGTSIGGVMARGFFLYVLGQGAFASRQSPTEI